MTAEPEPLAPAAVLFGRSARDRADAIEQCGRLLVEAGVVDEPYIAAMHEREASVSTFVGEEVAIPHGTADSRRHVRRAAVVLIQFPAGVDWGGQRVRLCVALAAAGPDQLGLLAALAKVLLDPGRAAALREATDEETVTRLLRSAQPAREGQNQ
ncbi:PTS sugar transporter subunit IIA [Amycolatopsis nigrescens]|uniref:PTS sugar transporter subunit IIA n=1 Tax=Amycolatopsis nigrescens TaxID=381445 RepID=UPI000364A470|nr:PTS sugar transporter subunit IIA [Amycolatopsis nigrescens]